MNDFGLPDKEKLKIIKKSSKLAQKKQQETLYKAEKAKLYSIKEFKEALYGNDLTKLNKLLNEEV